MTERMLGILIAVAIGLWLVGETFILVLEFVDLMIEQAKRDFAAIGGWRTVGGTAGALVGTAILWKYWRFRSARLGQLRSLPEQIRETIASAATDYRDAQTALAAAEEELEAGRAPMFWDQGEISHRAIDDSTAKVLTASRWTEEYNAGALRYNLDGGRQLEPLPQHVVDDILAVANALGELTREALTRDAFMMVYEQRRATSVLAELQAQGQERLQNDLNEILERTAGAETAAMAAAGSAAAAAGAARSARSASQAARRASKRAAGEWL